MPRGSRVGLRSEILATALELFLAQGYEATSLREIAEGQGITKAALYYHFPAKEQLVVELTRGFLNDLADLVARARAAPSEARETLRMELLSSYLDLLVIHRQVTDLLAQNPAAMNHPDVGQRARNLIDALSSELAGPDAKGEDKLRVACALGVVHAIVMTAPRDAEKAKRFILGAAVAALQAEPLAEQQRPAATRARTPRAQLRAT